MEVIISREMRPYYKSLKNKFEKELKTSFDPGFIQIAYPNDANAKFARMFGLDLLFDLIPECKEFIDRNKHRPHKDFLRDACRFSYKVYAYTHAIMQYQDLDGIIGIDADSVFYKKIDADWIKKHIHRDNCMMTYLGRPNYSECGFLYFNLNQIIK